MNLWVLLKVAEDGYHLERDSAAGWSLLLKLIITNRRR
jgi:hypothetical protein